MMACACSHGSGAVARWREGSDRPAAAGFHQVAALVIDGHAVILIHPNY
jgi:hypothetical protein